MDALGEASAEILLEDQLALPNFLLTHSTKACRHTAAWRAAGRPRPRARREGGTAVHQTQIQTKRRNVMGANSGMPGSERGAGPGATNDVRFRRPADIDDGNPTDRPRRIDV